MSVLQELGQALRKRRSDMGMSQARAAALSGLSRQTVCQIESGSAPDLGINKAERLASTFGLVLRVDGASSNTPNRRMMAASQRAAMSASVSYKTQLTVAELRRILLTGQLPDAYVPHIHALLDDVPIPVLAALAEELGNEAEGGCPAVWKSYRRLAKAVRCTRDIWMV